MQFLQVSHTSKQPAHWMMVYRCIPADSKKECTAKLEMKILGQGDNDRIHKHGKQYPCVITVSFYHNHMTTSSTVVSMESFKSQVGGGKIHIYILQIIKHLLLLFYQDIPPHLKEGFEGYFQETMQPAVSSIGGASTVNLNAIK